MAEDQQQISCNKPSYPWSPILTVEKSIAQWIAMLICALARDAQLPQGDVMGTVVDPWLVRWEESGIYMELSVLAGETVLLLTSPCLPG